MAFRRSLLVALTGACCAGMVTAAGQAQPPQALVTSPAARAAYLAHAVIWQDPGSLSPAVLRDGPPGVFPYTTTQAKAAGGIRCVFAKPGKALGGKSVKFTCVDAEAHVLRLKYWDPQRKAGNRETFATVAATRLMWALGFMAIPALPMNIQCDGCPEDPMSGNGARRLRRYIAMWQVAPPGPRIVSGPDLDQGWSWRDLGAAIDALPPGDERTRQRTHFAALTLLGVFLQHGDRKPEQQALYCLDEVDAGAADRGPTSENSDPLLVERPGASACPRAAAAMVDVGATFGGAGRTSNAVTAKMHLESWRKKAVFAPGAGACRGDLTVSLAAGGGSDPHPAIPEEGRRFLIEQLHRLTPDHLRAIFGAAGVDTLSEGPAAGIDSPPVDAWVGAFQEKVRQIEARQCTSAW